MMGTGIAYSQVPEELKSLPQWCIAGPDKAPFVGSETGLYHASPVTGPWLTFQAACDLAVQYGGGVGFILTAADPFTCIDLDVKDAESRKKDGTPYPSELWTTKEQLDGYRDAVHTFASYAELSASRKGVHIWVRGDIGKGIKRQGVEIYSQERFIVCTGYAMSDVVYDISEAGVVTTQVPNHTPHPLIDRQDLLNTAVQSMQQLDNPVSAQLEEVEEEYTDMEVHERAMAAGNADKYNALCRGEWKELGYPSQSEADLALMSMYTFYSKSNAQCRRLFRATALGKREKATKNNRYIDDTLKRIRSRQESEQLIETTLLDQARELVERVQAEKALAAQAPAPIPSPPPVALQVAPTPVPAQVEYTGGIQLVDIQPVQPYTKPPVSPLVEDEPLAWPPGLMGETAKYMFNIAPRPVKEVAIVGALGLFAGIAGKAFNIPASGLNLYIVLVAQSAVGKEAMNSGIHALSAELGLINPNFDQYIDMTDYQSQQALVKKCVDTPSFLNIQGEFGKKLERFAKEKQNDNIAALRAKYTELYQKSGHTSRVGGLGYSDTDKNVNTVSGVSYSLIGETTPETFFRCLTRTMMEDGFLSRFITVEYNGERVALNDQMEQRPPGWLVEHINALVMRSTELLSRSQVVRVDYTPGARVMLEDFEHEMSATINAEAEDESYRQMYNRAHLKVLRIAALLASADNPIKPVVSEHYVDWAIKLIRRDIANVTKHFKAGDIGITDQSRYRRLELVLQEYVSSEPAPGYNIKPGMWSAGVIPRTYLMKRVENIASFYEHQLGSTRALDLSIQTMIDNGAIMEIDKASMVTTFGTGARAFSIQHL